MDHATLTDNNGKKADFRNVILIMTSNAGTREMGVQTIGFGDTVRDTAGKGKKAVENLFSPEFRNRLDDTIAFSALTIGVMERIVDKFIAELNGQLAPKHVTLSLSEAARLWLARKGFDPQFGARPLGRVIQTRIKNVLSERILFGSLAKGGRVKVDEADDDLVLQ
jgi:ATP-dependent Clp protease ATP-binding subunit ClpA